MKGHAFFFDVAQLCEGKNLESAAVGKDRTVPARKAVETAERLDLVVARTKMEMICIAQLHLTLDVFQIERRNRAFYRSAGGNIHESGSLYSAVRSNKLTEPRSALLFDYLIHNSSCQK